MFVKDIKMTTPTYRRKFTAKYVVKFIGHDENAWNHGLIKDVRDLPPYNTEQQAIESVSNLMNTVTFSDTKSNLPGSGLFEIVRAVIGEWEAID
jgi:hypothetical protein